MRSRMLLATCALLLGSLVALPATAGTSRPAECPGGTFLVKYEVDRSFRFAEGADVVALTVTSTKGRGEIMAFSWSSTTPVSQFVVKAGRASTTVAVAGATSGVFTVPAKHAVSHVTFCRGEAPPPPPPVEQPPVEQPPVEQPPVEQPPVEQPPVEQPPVEQPPVEQPPVEQPPVVTAAGKSLLGCWTAEGDGTYSVRFGYLNTSTDAAGAPVTVSRTVAGFATSSSTLAAQFPTSFLPTGSRDRDAQWFTITGWDGLAPLSFQLFGTTKTMKADPSWSMPSNECF